jgi:hypothetical protein
MGMALNSATAGSILADQWDHIGELKAATTNPIFLSCGLSFSKLACGTAPERSFGAAEIYARDGAKPWARIPANR